MRLIAPEGIDVIRWFNGLRTSLNVYVPALLNPDDWRRVASQIRGYQVFNGKVPSPEQYKDWRAWARDFYRNAGG